MVRRQSDPWAWLSVLAVMVGLVVFFVGALVAPRGPREHVPFNPATLRDEAYTASCQRVTRGLKCPTTAIYPDEPTSAVCNDGIWAVIGYVDAQNSFGAMVRTKWGAVLHTTDEGKTWVIDSLVIGE